MVSWVHPEAMSLVKAKRLKTIDHEGTEVTSESVSGYERWTLFQKANVTAQDSQDGILADKKPEATPPTQPWRAIEAIQDAKGEVDVILDLVRLVRQGTLITAAAVQPPRTTAAALAEERALQAQSRMLQMKGAASQLRRGAAALRANLEHDARFVGGLDQLRRSWLLTANSDNTFAVNLSLLPPGFVTDNSTLGNGATSTAAHQPPPLVHISKGRDGAVGVAAAAPHPVMIWGVPAVHQSLLRRQRVLVWRQVETAVEAEAATQGLPWPEAKRMLQKEQEAGGGTILQMFAANQARRLRAPLEAAAQLLPPSQAKPPLSILSYLTAASAHSRFMNEMMDQLRDLQAECAPGSLSICRQPTGSNNVSALHVASGQLRHLVVVHKTRIVLENSDAEVADLEWLGEPATAMGLEQLLDMLQSAAAEASQHCTSPLIAADHLNHQTTN